MWHAPAKGRVIANRETKGPSFTVLTFGKDEKGEAYFLTLTGNGRAFYRFVKPVK
ncbi:MAG: hypothetical protein ACKV2Q_11445 [Planctomycetaceae bacterium]